MPIYEYVCKTCGERFEIKQKFSDPPIQTCAAFSCSKGEPVEKVISPPAIMFKGSGWYVTDYSDKLKDPKKTGSEGKTGDGKGEGTAAKPKETKPSSDGATSSTSASGSSSSTSTSSPSSSSTSS